MLPPGIHITSGGAVQGIIDMNISTYLQFLAQSYHVCGSCDTQLSTECHNSHKSGQSTKLGR